MWVSILVGVLVLWIALIGFADDAVIVAIVLRCAIRHAGLEAIERHWPGTLEGLDGILSLVGRSRA